MMDRIASLAASGASGLLRGAGGAASRRHLQALALWALMSAMLVPATAAPLGPIGDLHFESIDGSEVIADGVVTALAQDRDGFLWIGTVQGLVRFDGYRMQHFRHDPDDPESLGADFVRDLLPTAEGGLWVATGTGGVSLFDPQRGSFRRFRHDPDDPNSLGHDGVLALAAGDADGRSIWLALAGAGVDRFDPATERFEHHRNQGQGEGSIRHDTVRSLLRDRRGNLWVGTRRGLSRRLPDGRFEATAAGIAVLDSQYIYTLFESSDGRIWVGTQGAGAGWIDPEDEGWHPLPQGVESGGLAHPWVTDFAEPREGEMWVATYGTGIDVLAPSGTHVLRRIRRDPAVATSLALDSVTSLFRDASGLLWIGSWGGGLQRHNPAGSAFHVVHYSPTRPNTLSDASVLSALGRADGSIWVGTESHGIDVLDRQRGVVGNFRHQPGVVGSIPPGAISAMIEDVEGTTWVGTRQAGLHSWEPASEQFVAAPGATGSADTRISGLTVLGNGHILLVAESGLVQFDPASGRAELLRMVDGSEFGLPVLALVEDTEQRLWVGTARGLLRRQPGARGLQWVQPRLHGQDKPVGAVQALLVDPAGTLWMASADRLWQATAPGASEPEFRVLELQDALPAQLRWSELMSDRQGRFWSGNALIDPHQRRGWPIGRAEGADIGARTEGMPGRSHDGLLLFGGTRGLLIVEPDAFVPWSHAPALVTTEVSVDGVAMPWFALGASLLLPPSAHRFSVEFAALDLSAPPLNRYRYRLEGVDEDWIITDAAHRVATYSKLWPGRYQLQMSGSNRLGVWSPRTAALTIEVQPAFWQTLWFLLLMLLLLGGLIYLGFLLRTARIRQKSHELARLVAQRTDELSTAHRALLETQQKLAVQERVAALGGLVAGVAHEVSTPLGVVMTALSGIADAWKQVAERVRGGAPADALDPLLVDGVEYTELALRNSDRVGELVANLKAIVARRDSDHVEAVDLSLHLREVAALVRADLRERGCRIDVRVAEGLVIHTVPDALTEALSRVLRNTVDHAFPEREDGWVELSAQALADGGVEIMVRDNGRGIGAEALGQVFDPFFTTRRGRDGFVGLGLYVAYAQATQRLKGSIKVSSVDGEGTEVCIRVPDLTADALAG